MATATASNQGDVRVEFLNKLEDHPDMTPEKLAWIQMMREAVAKDTTGDIIDLPFLMSQAMTTGPGYSAGPLFTNEQVMAASPLPPDSGFVSIPVPEMERRWSSGIENRFLPWKPGEYPYNRGPATGQGANEVRRELDPTDPNIVIVTPPELPADFVAEGYNPPSTSGATEAAIAGITGELAGATPNLTPGGGVTGAGADDRVDGLFELWVDHTQGGTVWAVWRVETPNGTIPLAYSIPDPATFTEMTGGVIEGWNFDGHVRSGQSLTDFGFIPIGSVNLIPPDQRVSETLQFDAVVERYMQQAERFPWLNDPDILAIVLQAELEDRDVTNAELSDTEWFRTHTQAQRDWAEFAIIDPATATSQINELTRAYQDQLRQQGMLDPPESVARILAQNVKDGTWTATYANQQATRLSDPFAPYELDDAFANAGDLDTTAGMEGEVRTAIDTWLGPAFGSGFTQAEISRVAGEWRNDPDAKDRYIEGLKQQRLTHFPAFTDPNATYETIAAPTRNTFYQVWGELPDETDAMFVDVLNMNNLAEQQKFLRSEGLKRGNRRVGEAALSALGETFGSVRRNEAIR